MKNKQVTKKNHTTTKKNNTTTKKNCTTAKKTYTAAKKKGAKYTCQVCGMEVTVDEVCGCVETQELVCCGQAMLPKKTAATAR